MNGRIYIGATEREIAAQWYDATDCELKQYGGDDGAYWEFGGLIPGLKDRYPWLGSNEPIVIEIDGQRLEGFASKGAHTLSSKKSAELQVMWNWLTFHGTTALKATAWA